MDGVSAPTTVSAPTSACVHFFFDAAAGALVAGLAAAAAAVLTRPRVATTVLTALPAQPEPPPSFEELAA